MHIVAYKLFENVNLSKQKNYVFGTPYLFLYIKYTVVAQNDPLQDFLRKSVFVFVYEFFLKSVNFSSRKCYANSFC